MSRNEVEHVTRPWECPKVGRTVLHTWEVHRHARGTTSQVDAELETVQDCDHKEDCGVQSLKGSLLNIDWSQCVYEPLKKRARPRGEGKGARDDMEAHSEMFLYSVDREEENQLRKHEGVLLKTLLENGIRERPFWRSTSAVAGRLLQLCLPGQPAPRVVLELAAQELPGTSSEDLRSGLQGNLTSK